MVKYVSGDIFDSPAQVLVNPVYTVGVRGKGLALAFKRKYPSMYATYRKVCERQQLTIGQLMLYHVEDHTILLFPTKAHWRGPSRMEYLEAGLDKFVQIYVEKKITTIAFPMPGCGNGGLVWEDVKSVMEKFLAPLPITVYIYVDS